MDEMVEKVARAICKTSHIPEGCGWEPDEIESLVNEYWEQYAPEARAAIAVIRTMFDRALSW